MITCIIIEDQPPAQRLLQKYILDLGTLDLKAIFSDALEAMVFLQTNDIDLIFLDIHLPKLSGLNFLKVLNKKPNVILTTAFSDYALESYEFDVKDYLLKPFSFERFVQAVNKVNNTNNLEVNTPTEKHLQHIFIKSGYELIKVDLDDIFYIKSDTDYTEIITPNKKYLSNETLSYWEQSLPKQQFIRIHKSYIINFFKVEKIMASQVYLTNNINLPIGRVYKEKLMSKINKD